MSSISTFLNLKFFAFHFELNFEPFALLPLVCSTVHTSLNTKMLSNSSGAVRLPCVGCFVHKWFTLHLIFLPSTHFFTGIAVTAAAPSTLQLHLLFLLLFCFWFNFYLLAGRPVFMSVLFCFYLPAKHFICFTSHSCFNDVVAGVAVAATAVAGCAEVKPFLLLWSP